MNSRTGGTAGDGAGLGEYGSLWAKQYHKTGLFQLSELSLQGLAFQAEHVAVGGMAGGLELGLGPGQGELQRCAALESLSIGWRQRRLPGFRRTRIVLLRLDRLALPAPCHTLTLLR